MGNQIPAARLEEITSIFCLLSFTPTILTAFQFSETSTLWDTVGPTYYLLPPIIWLIFIITLFSTLYRIGCLIAVLISLICFYGTAMTVFQTSFNIYRNRDTPDTIDYIDNPLLAINYGIYWSVMILYFFLIVFFTCCRCVVEYFRRYAFFIPFELIILAFMGLSIYELTKVDSFPDKDLRLVYILITVMIGAMQLYIIVRPKTFKNAIGGLIDAFKWTNIRRIQGFVLFLYSGLSVALSAYILVVARRTRFHGVNNDGVPIYLIGLYFLITLQIFSGILGFIASRIIRKINKLKRAKRMHQLLHEEYRGQWIGIEEQKYAEQVVNNNSCPICIEEFVTDEKVARHQECNNGFHMVCLGMWIGEGKNTCPMCRKNIN